MSLAGFQDLWTALLFEQDLRDQLQAGTLALPEGFSQAEAASIRALPPARLDAVASAMRRGRTEVFCKSIPAPIARLLPPELGQEAARSYALAHPGANLYPRWQKIPPWLDYLGEVVQARQPEHAAHLLDLLAYEQTAAGLVFYQPPSPAPLQRGPCLSPQAGLTIAGPHLEELLRSKLPDPASLPATPRRGYLLRRGPRQVSLTPLHWSLFTLISRCQGAHTWAELTAALIEETPDLAMQKDRLLAWEPVYIRQGVLLPGQPELGEL